MSHKKNIWTDNKGVPLIESALEGKMDEAQDIIKDKNKIERLLKKAMELCEELSKLPGVGDVFRDLPLVCSMILDYVHGEYREVPLKTIIILTAAILYVVSPIDIILDKIPTLGGLDDAVLFRVALKSAREDIEVYKVWKGEIK